MELINNRYRVLKSIKQNRLVSTYLVTDVKTSSEPMQLNILNKEYIPEELLSYYIREFKTLATIDNRNIVKLYNFGTISFIDNKKMDNKQYYYINENIEQAFDLVELFLNMDEDKTIELFIEICQSLNCLHLRGFVYGELNTSNIHIENNKVKLKDMVTTRLEKYDYWTQKNSQLIFRAPEILSGGTPSVSADIYSLGVLLLFMCKKGINENLRVARELDKLKNTTDISTNHSEKLLKKIVNIIEKMTEQNIDKRYKNIAEIVEDINKNLNKNYSSHRVEELEKLNFNTKLVGREYEISNVLNMYNSMASQELQGKFVCFHGERGIGKTKVLRELEYLLAMKNANVYTSFTLEGANNTRNKGVYEILRKIIAESEQDVLERYESELIKLIPELAEKKKIEVEEPLQGEKEKLRLINSVCGFINDFLKGRPTVFIIDNVHIASEICVEILEHIYLRAKNIMVVFSYCDGELSNNKKLSELIANLSKKEIFIDNALFGLNSEETVLMIQDILRTPQKPSMFGKSIFSKTYGNPQFIEETIKKLFSEKVIFIDEMSGEWDTKYYDYSKLPIPSNMEQAVLSQLYDLNKSSLEVLDLLSLFNAGIPVEDLIVMTQYEEEETMESIALLELRGILIKKIEDRGFVYDFSNRILKNLVKDRLGKDYRKEKHKIAADLLEKLYETGIENREELIYHLENAGEYSKAIRYCLENADKMEKLKSRNEAIKNLLRAFHMLQPSDELAKLQLLLRLGNIYDEMGNFPSAIKCLEDAQCIAVNYDDQRYHIDVLGKLAAIYYKKNEIDKTLQYISVCEKLLYSLNLMEKYPEGYLSCKEVQARVYHLKQDHVKVKEICIRGIDLCGDEFFKLKGLFYKNLGNSYIETGKIEKAQECYEKSLVCFEKVNNAEGIAMALNNLSVVYGDFYQNTEKAISYMVKMKEISEKNHIVIYEVMALANLASLYYIDFSYELALDYLLEALDKSKNIGYESQIFYCYNYLSLVSLRLGNYKEAYEYYLLATKELEEYPEQGRNIDVFYIMSAELFYSFGDFVKAKEFIQMTLDIHENDEFMQKWDSVILKQYIELSTKAEEKDIKTNVEIINSTIKNYKSELQKLNIMYDTITILSESGFYQLAENLYLGLKDMYNEEKPDRLKLKELYVEGLFNKGNNKIKCFNSALEIAKLLKERSYQWRICVALGKFYLSKKDYFYAVNYYFEACEVIKNITAQMPEASGVNFVNKAGVLKPFNMLMSIGRRNTAPSAEIKVEDRASLIKLFDFEQFEDILTNKHFIRSAHKIYNSYLPKEIRDVKGIIKNLYSNPIKNLEVISKYLASITLATRSLVIIENYEQSYYTIASSDGSNQLPLSRFIFERVRAVKEPLLITEEELLPQGVKAVICIPIIMNNCLEIKEDDIRKAEYFSGNSIEGYIYLETDRILNNFNSEVLSNCVELSRLTGSIIEKYQLMISSSIDKLTGMLTRKSLEDALSEHIDAADRYNRKFSIIMIDMDHFKHINDRFGHQTGDEVLKKACQIIRNNIRQEDVCGRYGGEEFILILPQTDAQEAFIIADRLRLEVEAAQILGGKTPVTVSMGIASYPQNAQWKQELVEKADQALYVSKELGRNRCQLWNSEFSSKNKTTNKLIGIVSGNTVEDSRKVLAMLDIIELIKQDIVLEDKIFNLLGRIVEMTEAEYGMFFIVEDGKITRKYSRKIFEEHWSAFPNYNMELINSVINKKQGLYMTDWDETASFDNITGIPNWHSLAITPLIKNGAVKGVLYLTVSTKSKEFKFEEFNFVNTIGELAVGIL